MLREGAKQVWKKNLREKKVESKYKEKFKLKKISSTKRSTGDIKEQAELNGLQSLELSEDCLRTERKSFSFIFAYWMNSEI